MFREGNVICGLGVLFFLKNRFLHVIFNMYWFSCLLFVSDYLFLGIFCIIYIFCRFVFVF